MIEVREQAQADATSRTQTPVKVKKIGHVVYRVSDVERSVKFWTEVMGFKESDRNEHGTGAPHRRQKLSATEVVKVVGKPSAHLTYPCRKA